MASIVSALNKVESLTSKKKPAIGAALDNNSSLKDVLQCCFHIESMEVTQEEADSKKLFTNTKVVGGAPLR